MGDVGAADRVVVVRAVGRGAAGGRAVCILAPPGIRMRWLATSRRGSTPSFHFRIAASDAEWLRAIVHRLSPATTTWVGPRGGCTLAGTADGSGSGVARCEDAAGVVRPASGSLDRGGTVGVAGAANPGVSRGASITSGVNASWGRGTDIEGGIAVVPSPGRGTKNAAPMARTARAGASARRRALGGIGITAISGERRGQDGPGEGRVGEAVRGLGRTQARQSLPNPRPAS